MRTQLSMATTVALLLLAVLRMPALAQNEEPKVEEKKPAAELAQHEQAFVDLLSNATMVGTFTIGKRPDQAPKQERYRIQSVNKISDDNWIVQARITYGKIDVPVPVPVQMKWAGDTPVLQVTDLSLPLIGNSFTARVMFYEDYYAGAWWHGKVGGHMWGKIEKETTEKEPALQEVAEPESTDKSE